MGIKMEQRIVGLLLFWQETKTHKLWCWAGLAMKVCSVTTGSAKDGGVCGTALGRELESSLKGQKLG